MVHVVTDSEFMALGLELARFNHWKSYKDNSNVERFQGWFAAKPKTCETIWVDLQMAPDPEDRIGSAEVMTILSISFWPFVS